MGVHSEDSLEQAQTCINWSLLPFWLLPLPSQLRILLRLLKPRLSSMLLLPLLLLEVLPPSKHLPQFILSLLQLLLPLLLLLLPVFLMESVLSMLLVDILMLVFQLLDFL